MSELAKLRRAHEEAGSPPCEHRERDDERALSDKTGDTGCLGCGQTFNRVEERELQQRNAGPSPAP